MDVYVHMYDYVSIVTYYDSLLCVPWLGKRNYERVISVVLDLNSDVNLILFSHIQHSPETVR